MPDNKSESFAAVVVNQLSLVAKLLHEANAVPQSLFHLDLDKHAVKCIILAHNHECEERERLARIDELTRLDNEFDEVTPDRFHEYYINRIPQLSDKQPNTKN